MENYRAIVSATLIFLTRPALLLAERIRIPRTSTDLWRDIQIVALLTLCSLLLMGLSFALHPAPPSREGETSPQSPSHGGDGLFRSLIRFIYGGQWRALIAFFASEILFLFSNMCLLLIFFVVTGAYLAR